MSLFSSLPREDFLGNEIWDETPTADSIGDDLASFRNRVIGWTATILTALFIILGVWI